MTRGRYKRTEEHRKNASDRMKERKERLGYVNSPEARKKMSEKAKGKNNSMYGIRSPMFGRTGKNHPAYGKKSTSFNVVETC